MAESIDFKNPFRAYRAEQLEDVWRFYVRKPFDKLLSPKPLIYEGGRGSGKTMFFLCNSWRQKISEIDSQGEPLTVIMKPGSIAAFYYRVDAPFVGSFSGKGVPDEQWAMIFSTYFNVVICKEIFLFVSECIARKLLNEVDLLKFYKRLASKLGEKQELDSIESYIQYFDSRLDAIENFSNWLNEKDDAKIGGIKSGYHPGSLIREAVEQLRQTECFKQVSFHIFIDEYETLNEYQQKQINTLIKMSQGWLVYDIGVKTKGIKTFQTTTDEVIQPPHDFSHFSPEANIGYQEYAELLVDICRKRLEGLAIGKQLEDKYSDIRFYLGEYNVSEEVAALAKKPKAHLFKQRLIEIINQQVPDRAQRTKYCKELVDCDLINARMHLCLLLRQDKKKYSVAKICNEYLKWKQGKSHVYKNWLHNMSLATVFLLCREAQVNKQYNGFEVFVMLSSGVVRYFLELCEHAFDFAYGDGFSFATPNPLSAELQTKAARYVSHHKIADIEWFKPYGKNLSRFIVMLSGIFYELQTSANNTLGEPECNHFFSKNSELSPRVQEMLNVALMHNILQSRLPTKEKEATLSTETVDYFLNRICCPYFNISYRKKRKLQLLPNELEMLMLSDAIDARKAAKQILEKHRVTKIEKSLSEQMQLFED